MCKKIFLVLLCSIGVHCVQAQKPNLLNHADSLSYGWWTRGTQLSLNFTGAGFNSSWQGGAVNNVSMTSMFNNKAIYTKGKGMFISDLQGQLGFIYNMPRTGGSEFRKNLDRLFFDNKYSQKIHDRLSWYTNVTFLTQMLKGPDYTVATRPIMSNLFAPAYLTEGLGLEYKATPHLTLSGGLALKETFVTDKTVFANNRKNVGSDTDPKYRSFGIKDGKSMILEGGLQGLAVYDRNITKNINVKGRWQSFWAVAPVLKPVNEIDHNFSIIASAKLNKYISLNAAINGIYDRDIITKNDILSGKYSTPWQVSYGGGLGLVVQL